MNRPTLLILAAGMASRFGGLKQMVPLGPSGETIIDYSVYDAVRAGFGKVVFIIRNSIKEEFRSTVSGKFEGKLSIEYVFQELDNLPQGHHLPADRIKPWGTGHAIWVAADKINEPFAVINADDFYGKASFQIIYNFLKVTSEDKPHYAIVGYRLKNTLSEFGAVSRGLCEVDEDYNLKQITELTHLVNAEKGIINEKDEKNYVYDENALVSMNMMGFSPKVFMSLESYLNDFLNKNIQNVTSEFYLPKVVNQLVQSNEATVKVLPSPGNWFGMTYPDDKPLAIKKLHQLISEGVYPDNLWSSRNKPGQ